MGNPVATMTTSESGCLKLMVVDGESGQEIFHAEIWNFGNGNGDIDIFCPKEKVMKVLEWDNGTPTLNHISPVNHVAVDFKKSEPKMKYPTGAGYHSSND